MSTTIVRYRVKPGRAEENNDLVRAVYTELAEAAPTGFQYATYVADDGVSFTHVATSDDDGSVPLTGLAAFKAFRAGLDERCEQPPALETLSPVASYGSEG